MIAQEPYPDGTPAALLPDDFEDQHRGDDCHEEKNDNIEDVDLVIQHRLVFFSNELQCAVQEALALKDDNVRSHTYQQKDTYDEVVNQFPVLPGVEGVSDDEQDVNEQQEVDQHRLSLNFQVHHLLDHDEDFVVMIDVLLHS